VRYADFPANLRLSLSVTQEESKKAATPGTHLMSNHLEPDVASATIR